MPEEKEETKEEVKPSFLEEMEKKKLEMTALNERLEKNISELKELKAEDIMSGRVQTTGQTTKPTISPQEYAMKALNGVIAE